MSFIEVDICRRMGELRNISILETVRSIAKMGRMAFAEIHIRHRMAPL